MAYTKTAWVNDQAPAVDAVNLNKMEQGIYDAHVLADGAAAGTSGTFALRPSASASANKFYLATDQDVLYFSDGTTWRRQGLPVGATLFRFNPDASVPTGWIKYDGSALPASTGIYADIYAHLGNTVTTPDTVGRFPINKGTHADIDAIGKKDGLPASSRRPIHKHTVAQPTITVAAHSHTLGGGLHAFGGDGSGTASMNASGAGNWYYNTDTATPTATASGGTVGPQTGAEPVDSVPHIVGLLIAKL